MPDTKKYDTIDQVRSEIDRIDNQIIELLSERFDYVKEVVKFKKNNPESILAKPRYDQVLQNRKEFAESLGLNGEVIEKMYKDLLEYFISEQTKMFNNNHPENV